MGQRNQKIKRLGVAALAMVTIASCLAYYFISPIRYLISPAWCIRVGSAKVTINGKPSAAQLYRKRDGQLLLVLSKPYSIVYRVPPDRHTVYFGDSLEIVPTGAWDKRTRDINPYGVDLGYHKGVKGNSIRADTNATLVIRRNHIEFNGLGTERIIIDW